MTTPTINRPDLEQRWREAKQLQEEIDAEMVDIAAEINKWMDTLGVEDIVIAEKVATKRITPKPSVLVDRKALERDGLFEEYSKQGAARKPYLKYTVKA